MTNWSPYLLSVLRIVTGLLFLEHGTSKLFGFPPSQMTGSFHLFSMMGFSGVLEFAGGILIAIGLFTRVAAFILSGEMAVAYFMVHAPKDFFPWPEAETAANSPSSIASCFSTCFSQAAAR